MLKGVSSAGMSGSRKKIVFSFIKYIKDEGLRCRHDCVCGSLLRKKAIRWGPGKRWRGDCGFMAAFPTDGSLLGFYCYLLMRLSHSTCSRWTNAQGMAIPATEGYLMLVKAVMALHHRKRGEKEDMREIGRKEIGKKERGRETDRKRQRKENRKAYTSTFLKKSIFCSCFRNKRWQSDLHFL